MPTTKRRANRRIKKFQSNEINNLFILNSPIIVFANGRTISELFKMDFKLLVDPIAIKTFLIDNNSILLDFLNLGVDGSSLFIYSKYNNSIINYDQLRNKLINVGVTA